MLHQRTQEIQKMMKEDYKNTEKEYPEWSEADEKKSFWKKVSTLLFSLCMFNMINKHY